MSKLPERVEQLEGRMKPKPSPWIQKAFESLSDDDLAHVNEFFALAKAGRVAEAIPEQWAAVKTVAHKEAELKAEAERSGQRVSKAPLLIETLDELRRSCDGA